MVGQTNVNEGQNIAIAEVINNDWNPSTNDNDIAIVKLATPLTLGGDVQALCLPSTNFDPNDGANCFVSGWGSLASGGTYPDQLQYVGVPVVSQSRCNDAYGNVITDNMICAGLDQGGKDSCQGDSGGPFVCMEGGTPVITGVVSWGKGCADPKYPGVYARVTPYLDWIKQHMEDPGNPTTSNPPSSGCENNDWVGDNYCDDGNNNAGCNYDGGDCCVQRVENWHDFCTDCQCLGMDCGKKIKKAWGNGKRCNGKWNNAGCFYDGGDCCKWPNSKKCKDELAVLKAAAQQ